MDIAFYYHIEQCSNISVGQELQVNIYIIIVSTVQSTCNTVHCMEPFYEDHLEDADLTVLNDARMNCSLIKHNHKYNIIYYTTTIIIDERACIVIEVYVLCREI